MWTHPARSCCSWAASSASGANGTTTRAWTGTCWRRHHQGVQPLVARPEPPLQGQPALHELDYEPAGFEWIDANDSDNSVFAFLRYGKDREHPIVSVSNFTPIPREGYRVGVPTPGFYRERLNTDAGIYGGSDVGNGGGVEAEEYPHHGRPYSVLRPCRRWGPSSSNGSKWMNCCRATARPTGDAMYPHASPVGWAEAPTSTPHHSNAGNRHHLPPPQRAFLYVPSCV